MRQLNLTWPRKQGSPCVANARGGIATTNDSPHPHAESLTRKLKKANRITHLCAISRQARRSQNFHMELGNGPALFHHAIILVRWSCVSGVQGLTVTRTIYTLGATGLSLTFPPRSALISVNVVLRPLRPTSLIGRAKTKNFPLMM